MNRAALTLVATPIGNLGDLSSRAAAALTGADLWLAEDTRVSAKLAAHLGVKRPMRVVNEHTSEDSLANIVESLATRPAVLVTDGGAPGVSDPGARLCDLCHLAGLAVDAIPGPSAVVTALMLSGFYAQRFAFLGFLGRKPGAIKAELTPYIASPLTLVMFESPFRFSSLLKVAGDVLGPRRYAICREMTKVHQQVFRSQLPALPAASEVPAKGEVTVAIEGLRHYR